MQSGPILRGTCEPRSRVTERFLGTRYLSAARRSASDGLALNSHTAACLAPCGVSVFRPVLPPVQSGSSVTLALSTVTDGGSP
jgi:hypothetical protein